MSDIDTLNRCAVGALGGQISILSPPRRLSPAEARTFAAWLVSVADAVDPDGVPFDQVLEAVRAT